MYVKNIRESSMNVNSRFTICVNRELCEQQFSLFFMILSEKLSNFCVILREIAYIRESKREQDFSI